MQRAFRAHLLVKKCLNKLIVSDVMEKDVAFSSLVSQAEQMYTSVVDNNTKLEFVATSDIFTDFMQRMDKKKQDFSKGSKTSQLWLIYMKMIERART